MWEGAEGLGGAMQVLLPGVAPAMMEMSFLVATHSGHPQLPYAFLEFLIKCTHLYTVKRCTHPARRSRVTYSRTKG